MTTSGVLIDSDVTHVHLLVPVGGSDPEELLSVCDCATTTPCSARPFS
jgi:hypothetical protein